MTERGRYGGIPHTVSYRRRRSASDCTPYDQRITVSLTREGLDRLNKRVTDARAAITAKTVKTTEDMDILGHVWRLHAGNNPLSLTALVWHATELGVIGDPRVKLDRNTIIRVKVVNEC